MSDEQTAVLSVNEISYTLKESVQIGNMMLTDVVVRKPNSGVLLRARATIANSKALGPALLNDGFTMGAVSLKLCLVRSNLPQTPADWVDQLAQPDLMELLERFNALSEGFGTDLEGYRADVRRRAKEEELVKEREQTFP